VDRRRLDSASTCHLATEHTVVNNKARAHACLHLHGGHRSHSSYNHDRGRRRPDHAHRYKGTTSRVGKKGFLEARRRQPRESIPVFFLQKYFPK
jgi:hypothetical protein